MTEQLTAFLDELILYDYLLLGGTVLLFILCLLLAVLLRKRLLLFFPMLLLALLVISAGPTVGYTKLHAIIFKNTVTLNEIKALEFTEALLIRGTLKNDSKRDFDTCEITSGVHKIAGNFLLDTIYPLNPFQKASILLEQIPSGQQVDFKLFIEPFSYSGEYNISIGSECR